MNEPFAPCTVAIIAVTIYCSWRGFRETAFREANLFSVGEVLAGKQYHRLITSAFLHGDWNHLLLNMASLYLFGRDVELLLGTGRFLLVYFGAIVGGDLLSLWLHRHHEYRSYGASGGVCGLLFSYIILFPGSSIGSFFFPVAVPAWLYAIGFFAGSFFALKRQADNIGHDAHLGGAIIGFWTAAALVPEAVREQPKLFLALSAVSVLLLVYLVKNPMFLPLANFRATFPRGRLKRRESTTPRPGEREIDDILEKISRTGIDSLSPGERSLLNSVSREYQRRADSQKPDSDLII